jgi:hypothetical protein
MEDPIFDEIIDACKKKHVYKIMGCKYDWNNEIILNSMPLVILRRTEM